MFVANPNVKKIWLSVDKGEKVPWRNIMGERHFDSEHPLIHGNRRKRLRDFKNLRTRARILLPTAFDQRSQTLCARRMCRPERTLAPQHGQHDSRTVRHVIEWSLTSEHLCRWDNSKRKQGRFQIIHNCTSIMTIANE